MRAPRSHKESVDVDDGTLGPERFEPLQHGDFVWIQFVHVDLYSHAESIFNEVEKQRATLLDETSDLRS